MRGDLRGKIVIERKKSNNGPNLINLTGGGGKGAKGTFA